MSAPTPLLTGGCLCGSIRYECGPPVSAPAFCHCASCRRGAGAHVVAWMTVQRYAVVPADHIWMSDAPGWDRPGDGLPQHARSRQG